VSTYQPIAEELGITLGYTLAPALPAVALTGAELRSILQHLLHNSLKFTPPQGKVQVRGIVQRQMVELTVTDTGIGIEMADLPKVFNLFFRGRKSLQEEQPGAGLGLTLVKEILTRRGGNIKVNSHPGRGSQFQIFLPVFPLPPSL
jgi:signal transduction histidine kinase